MAEANVDDPSWLIGVEEVHSWINKTRYEEVSEFDVERGYIFTSCASVQNGNPIFWDEEAANKFTQGPIAPPTMLSVWFRPHFWSPGRTEEPVPWKIHFDLKSTLELPEAVATDSEVSFGRPVRPGDRITTKEILRSLSELKTTKLGTGRFWVIDAVCSNQDGQWVGTETMTGFGYRNNTRNKKQGG